MDEPTTRPGVRMAVRIVLSIVLCAILLGAAAGATWLIFSTEPVAESESATRRSAALVETKVVQRAAHRPLIKVLGVVEPARDIVLSPRVSGQILHMEPGFVPGGTVREGEPLLQIDPADFEAVLIARESELHQMQAELAIEEGRQAVSRQEFELLGDEIDQANRSLVLREPQIAAIRAQLRSAEAAVRRATLDLERSTVRAPFDAQILSRNANLGSQVAPGDELGRLVGVDEYWITASVPLRDVPWLSFADDGRPGARATIRHTAAWPPGVEREAFVARLIGAVDERSRLAQVLLTVADPLARERDAPPLILGTIVELRIEGTPIEDVVRLERAYVRQNDTVWVMVDDALEIRTVEVIYRDSEHAYIRDGLEDGEHVVTTSLATVTSGLRLRREGEPVEPSTDAAPPSEPMP